MNTEILKNQIRQIESLHPTAQEACPEIFRFIRSILDQIQGPVEPEFKSALRQELDRAYNRATQEA